MSADTTAEAQPVARGERVTVRAGSALRSTPGGDVIGVSSRDISGTVESVQSTFARLMVEGHVAAADVRLTADRTRGEVMRAAGSALRVGPAANAGIIAELRRGTYVFPERAGSTFPQGRNVTFLKARRSLWVDVSRLVQAGNAVAARSPAQSGTGAAQVARRADASAAGPASAAADTSTARRAAADSASRTRPLQPAGPTVETRGPTSLRTSPSGDVLANLPGGVGIATLAREDGWVRVRLEGWMPDSALAAAGAQSAGAVSAADLRANPAANEGRLVRWSVESLAFQTADELRRGLTPGEHYLLARGPGDERAVLYLAIPDSLVARAQALPPLAEISITARVRHGRSQPAGVPILDLLDLARR